MRSFQWLAGAIQKIHDGVAGEVVMVKAQRHASWDLDHNGSSADWFFDANRSGDVIVEMAVHNLDLCNWAIGSRPAKAAGFGGTLIWKNDPPGRTNMDGYTLSYEYRNGVKMSFTQNFFHPSGLPAGGQYTNVYGTKGAVSLETASSIPLEQRSQPVVLSTPEREEDAPHIRCIFQRDSNRSKAARGYHNRRHGSAHSESRPAKPFTRESDDLERSRRPGLTPHTENQEGSKRMYKRRNASSQRRLRNSRGRAELAVLICSHVPSSAQTATANINGYVRDTSGPPLPNATVTAQMMEQQVVRTAETNAEGFYNCLACRREHTSLL